MSRPGQSPVEWAARERRAARRGVRRRVTAWLGVNVEAKRADALAARAAHGAVGEQWTAALLTQLPAGWTVLHGRKMRGYASDFDHTLISPCGTAVVVLDSKRWHAQWETYLVDGRVVCGGEDRHRQIVAVAKYAGRLNRALNLGVRVVPLLVVHGSQVRGGFLRASVDGQEVLVLSPGFLVPTLVGAPVEVDRGRAADLAQRVDRVLPVGSG